MFIHIGKTSTESLQSKEYLLEIEELAAFITIITGTTSTLSELQQSRASSSRGSLHRP